MDYQERLAVGQYLGHCGPCSLSYCLAMLGIDASQRQLARAAGARWRVWWDGVDENDIRRAAKRYGVSSEFLRFPNRGQARAFATRLRRHLVRELPALLLVNTYGAFGHWIAAIGHTKGKFVVADPAQAKLSSHWGTRTLVRRAWNAEHSGDDGEPDQFFAILLRRRRTGGASG